MRFVKRIIVIFVLLLIAFFFYRLVNPTGAKALLFDLKNFSNTNLGTNFSIEVTEEDYMDELIEELTEELAEESILVTWLLLDSPWSLQEFTEEDELLFWDVPLDQEDVDEDILDEIPPQTPKDSSPTTVPKTSSNWSSTTNLSNQDIKDFKNLFGN